MQLPVLVKPLVSATTDSFRPVPPAAVGGVGNGGGSCGSAAAGGGVKDGVESPAASNSSSCAAGSCGSASNDGHTLGAIWTEAGLQALLSAGATSTHQRPVLQSQTQQQQQQQEQQQPPQKQEQPQLQLPVVLQQYVPHEALYKVGMLLCMLVFLCSLLQSPPCVSNRRFAGLQSWRQLLNMCMTQHLCASSSIYPPPIWLSPVVVLCPVHVSLLHTAVCNRPVLCAHAAQHHHASSTRGSSCSSADRQAGCCDTATPER